MKVRSHMHRSVACRIAALCAAFFVTIAHTAHAGINTWTGIGPEGVGVRVLVIDPITPTTLYAGTYSGVFKSTDAGATWGTTALFSGVFALAIDPITPTTLYAGLAGSIFGGLNIFKTTDGGATWASTQLVYAPQAVVVALAIDRITPSTLYAGTGGDVYKSTDAGATWHAINTGLPDSGTVNTLAIDPITPSTLYTGTSGGGPGGGVYKSKDAGATWEATSLVGGADVFTLGIDPITPTRLYAGSGGNNAGGGGVFKSTDAGATWEATGPISASGASVVALAIDPLTHGTLYAGKNGGGSRLECAVLETNCDVFKSTDGGGTWSPVRGLPTTFVNALAIDSTTIPPSLFAATAAGVFAIQEVTSVVGTGSAASCTDAALNTALAHGGLVTFDCGGPATIDISTGTGTKIIAIDTTVDGGGQVTISGGNRVGVFGVNSGIDFTVKNVTIANGQVNNDGAGIANDSGTLTVTNSTFSTNSASRGGGIYNDSGTLIVTHSTFTGNGADRSGGGIANGGTPTVTNSTFTGNSAASVGGGIYDATSTLTVTTSTFNGNSAGLSGGGVASDGIALFKPLIVANTTFFGNIAAGRGGGIYYAHNANDFLSVFSSTFTGNGAATGAAIYNDGNDGRATLSNTIIANSNGDSCVGIYSINNPDDDHSIDDGTSCGFSTVHGSLSNTNPQLDPAGLRDNGGPTQTVALCTRAGVPAGCAAASPAIEAAHEGAPGHSGCADAPVYGLDQRGFVRPGIGHTTCSIGAYEADATAAGACVGDCSATGNVTINELLTLVNIALGNAQLSACPHGVPSGTEVNVALIIQAVNDALSGCGGG